MNVVRQVPGILALLIHAKANQHSFCENPDVVLYVGEPPMAFHVELDVICDASPVLKAAFTGGFRESQDKTMRFPEEDVFEFDRFLRWTYLGSYPLSGFQTDGTAEERLMELARLYVLADRYDVVKLKHNIIDRVYEIGQCTDICTGPSYRVIRYVYANSTRLSFFRKLLVAWYLKARVYGSSFSNREEVLENEIPELQAEVFHESRTRGAVNPFARDRRVFYEDLRPRSAHH